MSRQEDFREMSKDLHVQFLSNPWTIYETGCEHGYQYAIDKVCEFLKKHAANFVALPDEGQQPIGDTNAIYGTKSLLYYLRKAMEE